MKRIKYGLIFFIGWALSPFTWWNDAFINVPISYVLANILFYITRIRYAWLMISSYVFTNILGLYFMYLGGKAVVKSSKNSVKTVVYLLLVIFIYSAIMIYLERHGKLIPLCRYFYRYCITD